MPLWPTHNHEVLSNKFLLVIAFMSNASGSFLILSTLLGSIWAIPATLVYTNAVRWAANTRLQLPFIILEALYISAVSSLVYNPNSTRYYLRCASLINLCCFFIYSYVPLLLYRLNGYILHFNYVRLYFVLKAVWNMGMIHVLANKTDDECMSPWLLLPIGLVFVLDAYIFIKQFFFLELLKTRRARRLYVQNL